jgi:hypothetical protein
VLYFFLSVFLPVFSQESPHLSNTPNHSGYTPSKLLLHKSIPYSILYLLFCNLLGFLMAGTSGGSNTHMAEAYTTGQRQNTFTRSSIQAVQGTVFLLITMKDLLDWVIPWLDCINVKL